MPLNSYVFSLLSLHAFAVLFGTFMKWKFMMINLKLHIQDVCRKLSMLFPQAVMPPNPCSNLTGYHIPKICSGFLVFAQLIWPMFPGNVYFWFLAFWFYLADSLIFLRCLLSRSSPLSPMRLQLWNSLQEEGEKTTCNVVCMGVIVKVAHRHETEVG